MAPFIQEERAVYKVSSNKRSAAFWKIVLENYENTCAITRSKFVCGSLVEAQAAHIISKEANGTDDPRNGIAMSHTTHWAFDHKGFEIFSLMGKKIILPNDESRLPHQDALLWHKEEVFGCFQR